MIFHIRGTHGAGKSTVVRRIMEHYEEKEPVMMDGRKRPIAYRCRDESLRPLLVLGSYETNCGGCDTIPDVQTAYDIVHAAPLETSVLYEGAIVQSSVTRVVEISKIRPTTVIVLATPLEVSIESVRARRAERGDDRPFDPRNVTGKQRGIISSTKSLKREGVTTLELDREAAYLHVLAAVSLIAPCFECGSPERERSACPGCGKVFCQPCAEMPYTNCCVKEIL